MTKKERDMELTEMVNEVLESLFYGDTWWNDGKPLTAERFYGDWLDKATGIVYNALDWFNLDEDEKEDFVRGNIDEMSSVFVDAKEIGQRLFKVYRKCLATGLEYGDKFSFDDWPIIGNEMIVGFEIDKDGRFIYIAEDQANPMNDYFVRLSTKEEFMQMLPILENEFFPDEEDELRINPQGEEEYIEICLDPAKHPKAFKARVDDLMKSGMTEEEATKIAYEPLEMELYFQPHQGLFMVETEAVESTDIFSPYTKERYKSPME